MQPAMRRAVALGIRSSRQACVGAANNHTLATRTLSTACRPRPAFSRRQLSAAQPVCRRTLHYSRPSCIEAKHYGYEDIKELSEAPSEDRILVDVREPGEYEAGFIPTALNIPVSSQPDALLLDPVDFETRFGFPKPDVNSEVVFYCKAGVRSRAAAKLAESGGYQKIGDYSGSWMDWVKNGGATDKP